MSTAGRTWTGAVVRAMGRFFHVKSGPYLLTCTVRESLKQKAEAQLTPVVVGDCVELEPLADPARVAADPDSRPQGVITQVHPRRSKFSKPKRGHEELEQIVAANIDQLLVVASVARPKLKPGLIDRSLIAAHKGELAPIVVINKIDLTHDLDLGRIMAIYRSLDVQVLLTSATEGQGIEELTAVLRDKQSLLIGHSGVGKSSLVRAVDPSLTVEIGRISAATSKGTHTTTAVQMFPLQCGGYVVDTPGLRFLGLWDINEADLQAFFPEISGLEGTCKFRDCLHQTEPGCAVKQAVAEGRIYQERYRSYLKLAAEL